MEQLHSALLEGYQYLTENISNSDAKPPIPNMSTDEIVRDSSFGNARNELRYVVSILSEDAIVPNVGSTMKLIMEDNLLVSMIVKNTGSFHIDQNTAPRIYAHLLERTRSLLYQCCNHIWRMQSKTARDAEGGPMNARFEGIRARLVDEPEPHSDFSVVQAYFATLIAQDSGTLFLRTANLMVSLWQYHWIIIQRSLREFAIVCNHAIPTDVLEAACASEESLSSLFSISTHLEMFDQLMLEHFTSGGTDVISPALSPIRDSIVDDLYLLGQNTVSAISSYLHVIVEAQNDYIEFETDDEDFNVLDSLMGGFKVSDSTVSKWLIDRFLGPLQYQMQTWPLCLIFLREFRETMKSKQIIILALRQRILPEALAKAIALRADAKFDWVSTLARVAKSQRITALHVTQLETVREYEPSFVLPLDVGALQSALTIIDEFSLPHEKRMLTTPIIGAFSRLKEHSVRLRATLASIVDQKTANSVEASETEIPILSNWIQFAFMGQSLSHRDQLAAITAMGNRGDTIRETRAANMLRTLLETDSLLPASIDQIHRKIADLIRAIFTPLEYFIITWQRASIMQRNAARVIQRCIKEPDQVACEIIGPDILWISQLACCTFPESENACLTMLHQLATTIMYSPFHLHAMLDRDPEAIVAAVSQAERQVFSELDIMIEIGGAADKIPDAAQDNPWHGWRLFPSEPIIVPPHDNPLEWSETGETQLSAAGISIEDKVVRDIQNLGSNRLEAGLFAMPNTGLMSGVLQERIETTSINPWDARKTLLAYLMLEVNFATGRPLNDERMPTNALISAINIASESLVRVSIDPNATATITRTEWYANLTMAMGMACIGLGASTLLATCIGNKLVTQLDNRTFPTNVNDPYITSGMRVLLSEYPHSILPPNVEHSRSRDNFDMLVALRYLQTIPQRAYENLRLDTRAYYAGEHAFYVAPTAVSSRPAFFGNTEFGVRDIVSAISYATPKKSGGGSLQSDPVLPSSVSVVVSV